MTPAPTLEGEPATVLEVATSDGRTVRVGSEWLRDHCRCEACWPEGSQRRYESWASPASTIRSARLVGEDLIVEFGPDGHIGTFHPDALQTSSPARDRDEAGDLRSCAWHGYADLRHGGAALLSFLADVERHGIGLVGDVPCEDGEVARVAGLFSFVLETNYGGVFDVRTTPRPANLAFSDRGLGLHTDNPYREPVPSLQLLHCLVAAPAGGVSRLLDGVAFARRFRESKPREFDLLSQVAVTFTYEDDVELITARSPIIELDTDGDVVAIRHNSRSARPEPADPERSNAWYSACRAFTSGMERDPSVRGIALQPSDLVCFDNRRVLHGRTAFTDDTQPRHLQGCYAAMDAVRSRLAAHRREVSAIAAS